MEKSLDEIRVKSTIGQRLKRLVDKRQSLETIHKTLKPSSLWKKIKASDVVKLSKNKYNSLMGSEIITDTIPEEPNENLTEYEQTGSKEVASSIVFYVLEIVFITITQEDETNENRSDVELSPTADVDECANHQKDEKDVNTGNSNNVSKSKRKSGKTKTNSAKEMRNSSKKISSKRTTKSAANLPLEIPEEKPNLDPSNDLVPEKNENSVASDITSTTKLDQDLLRPENRSILKNVNNPGTDKQPEDLELRVPCFESEIEKRLSYKLAYETLKCKLNFLCICKIKLVGI